MLKKAQLGIFLASGLLVMASACKSKSDDGTGGNNTNNDNTPAENGNAGNGGNGGNNNGANAGGTGSVACNAPAEFACSEVKGFPNNQIQQVKDQCTNEGGVVVKSCPTANRLAKSCRVAPGNGVEMRIFAYQGIDESILDQQCAALRGRIER